MANTRRKVEYLSSDSKKLEDKVKELHGTSRGRAFIENAKQNVDYQMGSNATEQILWTKKYEEELKKLL